MNTNKLSKLAAAIALAASLGAGAAFAADAPKVYPTGFLTDYAKLQPVEGTEGAFRYRDTAVDLRPYTKLSLEPVQVFMSANPEYKGMQPDALKRMTDTFRQAFVDALSSGYQITDQPGPDVLRVRLAITGVQPAKPPLGASDFIPIKALFNMGRAAAGASPKVAEMSAEVEFLTPDNKVVAAAVVTRKGEKSLEQAEKITWKDLQEIVTVWSKNLRLRLDEARGVAAPQATK